MRSTNQGLRGSIAAVVDFGFDDDRHLGFVVQFLHRPFLHGRRPKPMRRWSLLSARSIQMKRQRSREEEGTATKTHGCLSPAQEGQRNGKTEDQTDGQTATR